MISDADVCNEHGDNELRNSAAAAYTPAYTEILNGGGETLMRVFRTWPLLPEHVRKTILLLIESAAPSADEELDHE